ncbi:type III restriction/modification system, modification subunit [Campylobacter blaseri]|uniref:site-specific DNA-methyltransferase (adenine-specific) n=1 Tax=Campylobacter blaseri TaxID=2042961 RepID=A0A2P8QZU4_9BACT|nr:site-specific DNA-methyltransferase [Campylobacter blaseri]PSM51760.1 site-specific DNA-methyltransferase [Campylobacter blaseri]PSM53551.1 site-specific DNA-methyltransferase [Campylobacter blaseri]QKF86358.1 type III restriction/modification system, modification subunit [Campylobacter blaseri]
MDKHQNTTNNIKPHDEKIDILKKHFGNCFTKDGKINFEKLKQELAPNEMNFYKESYSLEWLGKSYARILASDEATTLLKEDKSFNQKEENKNSQNLLIKGDNLEVLKHLSNAYYEKIKMIYIDPPYNTGGDGFVYEDDRKFTVSDLVALAGISKDKAKQILEFTKSKSNSHSAWLTFMYPRLYIAKTLLRDDGVIFVSIDDNEVAQLRLIMDEIFGEENFVSTINIYSNPRGRQSSKNIAETHEYILVYSKTQKIQLKGENLTKDQINEYNKQDENGFYREIGLRLRGGRATAEESPSLHFPIFVDPTDNSIHLDNKEKFIKIIPKFSNGILGTWRWSKDKIIKDKKLLIARKVKREGKLEYDIFEKNYLFKNKTRKIKSTWMEKEINYDRASNEQKDILGNKFFDYAKPLFLLKKITQISTANNDIILDFFAGSATTGHAIMQLNAQDGGDRKFILVQLPEKIDEKKSKVAYEFVKNELKVKEPTIFEITKERLIRAAKKIKDENKDKDLSEQDFGFRIFETMPIWEDYRFDEKELSSNMALFDEKELNEEDLNALLITWKTYDGSPLTKNLITYDLDGYSGYYVDSKLYLMHRGFKTKNLKALLEKIDNDKDFNPTTIIAFGYNFESKSLLEISENIKSYANKKSIDIDFITRY